MRRRLMAAVVVGVWLAGVSAVAEEKVAPRAVPLRALARMPVKEVTVFKDGHAFVLHEGNMPTDGSGNVSVVSKSGSTGTRNYVVFTTVKYIATVVSVGPTSRPV